MSNKPFPFSVCAQCCVSGGDAESLEARTKVIATSEDGINYTATVPGITELYTGLEITIIPNMSNANDYVKLDVNGLGSVEIVPMYESVTSMINMLSASYLIANRPIKLIYEGSFTSRYKAWRIVDKQIIYPGNLFGYLPVIKGGTGADTADDGMYNLMFRAVIDDSNIVNADTLKEMAGVYRIAFSDAQTATDNNFPAPYGTLYTYFAGNYYVHEFYDTENNRHYYRTAKSSTWSSWQCVATGGNIIPTITSYDELDEYASTKNSFAGFIFKAVGKMFGVGTEDAESLCYLSAFSSAAIAQQTVVVQRGEYISKWTRNGTFPNGVFSGWSEFIQEGEIYSLMEKSAQVDTNTAAIGDINTALDEIIAIQESLIGGESE